MKLHQANEPKGMILIVVLWAVAMMTLVVVALSAYAQRSAGQSSMEAERLRTQMALAAGLEAGKAIILARPAEQRAFFDGTPATIEVDTGRKVTVSIQDEAGLLDINRARADLIQNFSEQMEGVQPGITDLLASAVQLRDAAQKRVTEAADTAANVTTENVTTETETKIAGPAFYVSLQELYALGDDGAAGVDKILPLIGLYSLEGKINPMSAPDAVMSAVPDLSPAAISAIDEARRLQKADSNAIKQTVEDYADYLTLAAPQAFRVRVEVTSGVGLIRGSELQATVLLKEEDVAPFRVLALSW